MPDLLMWNAQWRSKKGAALKVRVDEMVCSRDRVYFFVLSNLNTSRCLVFSLRFSEASWKRARSAVLLGQLQRKKDTGLQKAARVRDFIFIIMSRLVALTVTVHRCITRVGLAISLRAAHGQQRRREINYKLE
jgi:hypothetical protein